MRHPRRRFRRPAKTIGLRGRDDPFSTALAAAELVNVPARVVIVGGSAAQGLVTLNSDLDVVVVADVPEHREVSLHVGGWSVQILVSSRDDLLRLWQQEIVARWCPLLRMCAEGVVVLDSLNLGADIQTEAQNHLSVGAPPISPGEAIGRAKQMERLVADLVDLPEGLDKSLVGSYLITAIAETMLLLNSGWLDRGKWLSRRLLEASPADAESLRVAVDAWAKRGESAALLGLASDVAARAHRHAMTT